MASNGGSAGNGGIFAFDTVTRSETVLHSFLGYPNDSGTTNGSLIQSGTLLYGMSQAGGSVKGNPLQLYPGNGTIFPLDTTNNSENILYSFGQNSGDGLFPQGALLKSGSILYATTDQGGIYGGNLGTGALIAFNTATHQETVLHSFGASTADGSSPNGSLIQIGPVLYGTTVQGGSAMGIGTIFSLNTTDNTETVIHAFGSRDPADGTKPYGALLRSASDPSILYGMTTAGGASGKGTIYSFDTSTNIEKVLYSFAGSPDGDTPSAGDGALIQSGSVLYGTTGAGGTFNQGTIFSFDTATNTETVLKSMGSPDYIDGVTPDGALTLVGSTLYGTTNFGGPYNAGTIFAFTLPELASATLLAVSGLFFLSRRRRATPTRISPGRKRLP